MAKYINQASVNIGGPQVTKVFPYSKVASLLDDEPDKLLIVSGKEPVNIQWRLKNKSNVPWSENQIRSKGRLRANSDMGQVTRNPYRFYVMLKKPEELEVCVSDFVCQPL